MPLPLVTTGAAPLVTTSTYPIDRLDLHINQAIHVYTHSASWGDFIRTIRGRGDIHPHVGTLPHPASGLLDQFGKEGTPASMSGPPWDPARIATAISRGPHQSSHLGIEFLREEYADMMDKQQWTVLPASLVRDLPSLCLSPLGLVPQRGRRPRMISDYTYSEVNQDTIPLAPAEAMQFGRTLPRLLTKMHRANNRFGPLKPEDTMKLAVLFPAQPGKAPLIGIPLTNPMGWKSSPPNFCAFTETIADLANAALSTGLAEARLTPHRLDLPSEATPNAPPAPAVAATSAGAPPDKPPAPTVNASPSAHPPTMTPHTTPPSSTTDRPPAPTAPPDKPPAPTVNASPSAHAPPTTPHTTPPSSTTPSKSPVRYWDVYGDDFFFRPLDATDTPFPQEPASLKKILQGDATWTTKKILGELRSMALAIPGSIGLFSILQEAFRHQDPGRQRLRLTKRIHSFLRDFQWLANDLSNCPTAIAELVPDTFPATLRACDASGAGMGGIHFVPLPDGKIQPIMWRHPFPQWGTINNSDLKLTGSIAHNDILAQVLWPATSLLRSQALHQRLYQYVPLRDYIPGPVNHLADLLSRSDLSDTALLHHFNTTYPQDLPWISCHLRPPMHSALTLALSRRPCELQSLSSMPSARMPIGINGFNSVCLKALTHTSNLLQIQSPSSKVFAKRLHDGRLSCSHKPLRSCTVSDTIRSVGQTLARLGAKDPQTNSTGSLDFRLMARFKGYAKLDPAPCRVKPVPITLAIANMICIAFFFCLRPGEYTGTTRDDQAFHLKEVSFYLGSKIVHHDDPAYELLAATSVTLTFTTQKNGDNGEIIAHARSGDSLCCPHPPFSPSLKLASYFDNGVLTLVRAATVTSFMRGKCDSNVIKLLARWHSDCMMRYLHQQSFPIFQHLASVIGCRPPPPLPLAAFSDSSLEESPTLTVWPPCPFQVQSPSSSHPVASVEGQTGGNLPAIRRLYSKTPLLRTVDTILRFRTTGFATPRPFDNRRLLPIRHLYSKTPRQLELPNSRTQDMTTPTITSGISTHSNMLTYSEYFQATASPFGSASDRDLAYATIYDYFSADDDTLLLGQLLDLFEAQAVGALGIFVADTFGKSRLRLVHGLRKYPGPLAQPSANNGKAFCYLDDIEGDAGELVLVNSTMLARTSATLVLALDHHLAEVVTGPPCHHSYIVPMVLGGDAHMEVVNAYKACFIPFELVPLLLGKGHTPLQALRIIHPFLSNLSLVETCSPMFDTLRAVGTVPSIVAGNITLIQPSPPFRSEPGLTLYMKNQVLYRDLPGLKLPTTPGDPALTVAMTALTDHQLRLSEGLDQRRPSTVKNTWGPCTPSDYYCSVKSKHEKTHMIFQSQRFQDSNFYGTDPFDVADGTLPLAFNPPPGGSAATLKREQEAAANVAAYDTMITTKGNSLTLKDSLELQKTKAYIPVGWTEAITQLESYLAVLATILGVHHEVVQGYQNGLMRLKLQQMPLQRAIADKLGELITPSIVLYYFQIGVRGWLEEQWGSTFHIRSPDFGTDFHAFRITQNLHWLPNVSNVAAVRHLQRTSQAPSHNAAGNNTKTGTPRAGPGSAPGPGSTGGTWVPNPSLDPWLKNTNHPVVQKLGSSRMRGHMGYEEQRKQPVAAPGWPRKQDQIWEWCQEVYATKRVLFKLLDKIFHPLHATDTPYDQEPASLKKILQGDATWTTKKVILGWLINSINKTISLPPHRVERLKEILHSIAPTQRHVPIQQWHKVRGELRSMALAIPGSIGLFSILQEAFQHKEPNRQQIRLTKRVQSFLRDFQWKATDLSKRPTAIVELVPDIFPATLGACNALGADMGGIHFVPLPDGKIQPLMWRQSFPKWVFTQLVTFNNPEGTINNSDLKLAGSIAHNDVLAQAACVTARTTHNCYDNTAAALHQRLHQYVSLRDYIPGPVNHLADLLSRSELSDTALLHQFNTTYPQDLPWILCPLRPHMLSTLTLALSRRPYAHWNQWVQFCLSQGFDPLLQSVTDPIPSSRSLQKDSMMADCPTLAHLGSKDPQTNSAGSFDFRLMARFKGYAKLDSAPSRAIANMICIAFFFCLQPGEYTGTTRDDQAFSLQDVSFYLGSKIVHHDSPRPRTVSLPPAGYRAVFLQFSTLFFKFPIF
eukprot:jgi/Psemu1/50546/gm1.50546_g